MGLLPAQVAVTESLRSWKRRRVCVRASCPLPLRELLQQTFQKRLHLPAALQPYKPSAHIHSFACSLVAWRLPPSPRSAHISTHSPATADLSLGDQSAPVSDLPGASSAPPALVYTASGALGSLASIQLQQSPDLHKPAHERCLQGSPSASSQCLPCPRAHAPVLAVPSGSHILQSCQWRKEIL